MRRSSVKEYVDAIRVRYQKAGRKGKGLILDEFTNVSGYHRKSAVRLISGKHRTTSDKKLGRPQVYPCEVVDVLKQAWEATDRICGKRLHPFLPELTRKLEECGELQTPPEVVRQVCEMSASTIDRVLRPYKDKGKRRPFGTTKPGSLLKGAIPIRTFAEWNDNRPGFLEVDLVAHCGESVEGFYLNTLSAVDIASGWVECRIVWGKGQDRVGGAVHSIAQSMPFPLLGLDSDNGGEFINQHLYTYCQRKGITFTRSRPYKKNDNAHVEQKNWTAVRRLIGYERYSSKAAYDQFSWVYKLLRLYINFFQPAMKLQLKTRHGAKVHKVYDIARTPYQRVMELGVLASIQRQALETTYHTLNPIALRRQVDKALEDLWRLADSHAQTHLSSVTMLSEATIGLR